MTSSVLTGATEGSAAPAQAVPHTRPLTSLPQDILRHILPFSANPAVAASRSLNHIHTGYISTIARDVEALPSFTAVIAELRAATPTISNNELLSALNEWAKTQMSENQYAAIKASSGGMLSIEFFTHLDKTIKLNQDEAVIELGMKLGTPFFNGVRLGDPDRDNLLSDEITKNGRVYNREDLVPVLAQRTKAWINDPANAATIAGVRSINLLFAQAIPQELALATNCEELILNNNEKLTRVELANMPALRKVSIQNTNHVRVVHLSNMPLLAKVETTESRIESLVIEGAPQLKKVHIVSSHASLVRLVLPASLAAEGKIRLNPEQQARENLVDPALVAAGVDLEVTPE